MAARATGGYHGIAMRQPHHRHQAVIRGKAWEGLRLRIGASGFGCLGVGAGMAEGRPPQAQGFRRDLMSTGARQLRLVTEPPPQPHTTTDPARMVFDHWVFMFGLMPARTKLDDERRKVINAAVALYGLDLVLLAVDGMAAAPLGDKPESMRLAMREISWFLAGAKRVESCLRYGDDLHAVVNTPVQSAAQAEAEAPAADPAAVRAHKERLKAMADQMRGAHGR